MNELVCLLESKEVGRLSRRNGKLSFVYSPAWRATEGAYPISLSMPLAVARHSHNVLEPFLWGLLPDNELVIQRWAARFQVSARNVFAILSHVGEDCAGAIQFVPLARLPSLLDKKIRDVHWIDEADIAARLSKLIEDGSTGRAPEDRGQFSLSGAQPKTALFFDSERWGIPSGRTPTTHILKPVAKGFDGHAQNEHFCLSLARTLGLPTARTQVRYFDDVACIIVERYDRLVGHSTGSNSALVPIRRVHQEDMCQALGVHPAKKYQNEGGPAPQKIIDLIRSSVASQTLGAAEIDVQTFVSALVFNWLIGGTDAHAKNYSILLGYSGYARLAPLYDIASIYAYPNIDPTKAKLAMKIGREYEIRKIGTRQWRDFAKSVKLPEEALLETVRSQAMTLQENIDSEFERTVSAGLKHHALTTLRDVLNERVKQVLVEL
jgi:serine/threonine-protein kinase HipA